MSTTNWSSQVHDYRGVLVFSSCTDSKVGKTYGQTTIPLFIKQMPVPVRKPKITEISTLPTLNYMHFGGGHNALHYAAPEPLTLQLTGWLITPRTAGFWDIKDDSGTSMALEGVNLADLLLAYIEGRMDRESTGQGYRKDPTQFIDPYGNVYSNPIITSFDAAMTPIYKKQTFNMTLWLET